MKALLESFRYHTNDWDVYERHLETNRCEASKSNIQKTERKILNPRTRRSD
ncbi:hypothetical protein EKO24_017340 [Candidatus Methylobacter oryzae]|uniref:Uncharacterized protein n=1 Tax=Candidatus Methylobacter oryzae TaxID=2497749 RepID=A0ABY3C6W5_9GAMM|nr:hypothetical protein EKO24_017340 [Candidatus Methylobacter oryzae]